jgi:lysophospholipase L1-like esterase
MKALETEPGWQRLPKVLLVLSSVAVALVVCEVVLRLALPGGFYIWPPHLERVFTPRPEIMPGVSGESRFLVNSQGVRGDEVTPGHTHRIITLGASTTECLYLDQQEAWPHLLQERLDERLPGEPHWVGNGGMSGRTSRHHLMALDYLPLQEMRIDTVIVLMGANDLAKRLSRDHLYDPDFMLKPESREILLAETFEGGNRPHPNDSFLKRTAIRRVLLKARRKLSQMVLAGSAQDEAGEIYVKFRRHRQSAAEMRDDLPDLSSALGEYARNINRMIDVAGGRSVRLIFVTQPAMWRADLPEELEALLWFGGIGPFQDEPGMPYYSAKALAEGIDLYNATLLETCRERRVECLDLAAVLEKDTSVFYDDVHFNESGARRVATAVAEFMSSRVE